MYKQTVRTMTALVGAVLWITSAMQAQYVPHYVKVSVPFEFTVGDRLLPAGDYEFVCTPIQVDLRDVRGRVVATAIHHSVRSSDAPIPPKLVFTTDSGGHVLRQIWPGSTNYGYELAPSNLATVMAKQRSNAPARLSGGGTK